MGIFAGYHSARTYKMFKGIYQFKCALFTATLYPSIVFTIFLILNIGFAFQQSSATVIQLTKILIIHKVRFPVLLVLMALWYGVSVPLVILGSFIGFKMSAIKNPVEYNVVPSIIKK